jgi:hypothetical protein
MLNPETWGDLPNESILIIVFYALGPYVILLPLASFASFFLTLKILRGGRGPYASSALLLVIPTPFLIGIFGGIQEIVSGFSTMAPPASIRPQEIIYQHGLVLFPPLIGLLLTMPAYAFAIAGTFCRSLSEETIARTTTSPRP